MKTIKIARIGGEFIKRFRIFILNPRPMSQKEFTPADFTEHPFDSVFKNWESERIARNIMIILSRTGNKWRPLTWEEYKEERLKDKNFTEGEQEHYWYVISHCRNVGPAYRFSPSWAEIIDTKS